MWFTETPWPPMVILAVAAIACGWMYLERRQSWWMVGAIVCVALIGGVWTFEGAVITPREQIAQHVLDLTSAFQQQDSDEVLSFISPRAEEVRAKVAWAFLVVTEVEHLRITDTEIELLAQGSRAKSRFRANGTFTVRGHGNVGHQPTHWLLTWQQEGGIWKVIDAQRLDTITGEPMGIDDARR